jgi:hypothetical protein
VVDFVSARDAMHGVKSCNSPPYLFNTFGGEGCILFTVYQTWENILHNVSGPLSMTRAQSGRVPPSTAGRAKRVSLPRDL